MGDSPPFVAHEIGDIGDGHRLIAVRTGAARSHAAAEALTVGAALLAQVAGATRRALIDGRRPRRADGQRQG